MTHPHPLTRPTPLRIGVTVHTAASRQADAAMAWLIPRFDVRDDRGDVTPRTVGIAVMTAAAVGVGTFITQKITDKAATIDLDGGGVVVGGG